MVMKKIYTTLFALACFLRIEAQNEFFMQGGSSVTIQNNGLLYVKGQIVGQTNGNGPAQFSSDGTVIINTNNTDVDPTNFPDGLGELYWNTGTSIFNSDSLIFTGDAISGDGRIRGNASVSTGTLRSDLTRIIGSLNEARVLFDRNVTITNRLAIDNGILQVTGTNEIDVTNNAANAITSSVGFGVNGSNYVIGKLKRAVVNTGSEYIFPIGSENKGFNRFDLLLNSAPSGSNSVILEFEEFIGTPYYNNPTLTTVSGCSDNNFIPFQGAEPQYVQVDGMVSNFGFWKVRATNQNNANWNYGLNAYPNLSDNSIRSSFAQFENIRLIKGDDNADVSSDWSSWINLSGNLCSFANFDGNNLRGSVYNGYPIVNYIPARGLTGFSNFGAGGGLGSGLPVELVTLKADPIDNEYIKVSWTTATEINNAGFEVLRSEDGINFTNIGWVEGAGYASTMLNYNFDDHNVEANKMYYYRLRQVDFDGQSDLTNIVSAMISDNAVFVISEFMPNPTSNTSSFTVVTAETRDIDLTVYNTLGQIISDSRLVAEGNKTNKFDIDLSEMAAGTYYAVITTGPHSFNKKIVVSR